MGLAACIVISLLPFGGSSQSINAQSDLFDVLQNNCSNYLDVIANDNIDSLFVISRVQVISSPLNGFANDNGFFISYCPQQSFLGTDQFTYSVTIDSFRTDTATIYINVLPPNNIIYPGDADQNGEVQHFDVLSIGLTYGLAGPSRDSSAGSSLAWAPVSFINSDPGASDCNGDGFVDVADALVVDGNFESTFPVTKPYEVDTSLCSADGIPLYIESLSGDSLLDGDTLEILIRLGENNIVSEAYGVAFSLEFDNRVIGGSQIQFSAANSWLVQNDAPIFFKKDFQQTGEVQVALTKTNHFPALGSGEILSAILPIDDNIDGIAIGTGWHDLRLNLRGIRLISEYDIVRDVCVEQPQIKVYKLETGFQHPHAADVKIYPNPSSGKMQIVAEGLREIEITDLFGKMVFTSLAVSDRMEINIPLAPGVYLISIKTRDVALTKKLFIQP